MVTMAYRVLFTDVAREQIDELTGKLAVQVDRALEKIAKNPRIGKPLRGDLRGLYSERVATFRILYSIHDDRIEIVVLTVAHRRHVYAKHR